MELKELSELHLSERQSGIVNSTMTEIKVSSRYRATGSGKTTTLYAFINSINQDDINIHTIEDPIEYEIEGINQLRRMNFMNRFCDWAACFVAGRSGCYLNWGI